MAQIFWEQIRNELPSIGEFLTGSLSISGSFNTSGSVGIELNGVDEEFIVAILGNEQVKVNNEGVLQLSAQDNTPTAVEGGIFYSGSDEYYFGFTN